MNSTGRGGENAGTSSPDVRGLRVVAAACRIGELVFSLPPPARHHTILHAMHALKDGMGRQPKLKDQGFLLSDGTFAERQRAADVALRAGQIERPQWPPHLYSEDLW